MRQIKQILLTGILLFCVAAAIAQGNKQALRNQNPAVAVKSPVIISQQLRNFLERASRANVTFVFPKGFKEIVAPDDEDYSYDYAMELPGKGFEIWFQVKSQKENYAAFLRTIGNKETMQGNPDSLYKEMGTAQALAFAGDPSAYFTRTIPQKICARYNANAGKSYLLNLLDLPITKRFKYALLVTLQKDHTGTILAVCFSNEKGPEFYKNVDLASNCIKFKP